LILSDVIGDDLEVIGSGPTAPDQTTYADACRILRRYRLRAAVPARVRTRLTRGVRGTEEETPKPGSSLFRRVQNHIIGNNGAAVEAVAQAARQSGFRPLVLSTSLIGEAKEAAKVFGAIAREIVASGRPVRRPTCVIAGGELTVTVRGKGQGGRAQEFALAAAIEIAGLPRVWIAAFATDGTDGPTDAAGAVVHGQTVARAQRVGLIPHELLLENNAYPFFRKVGGHIISGPTGTNVNDLYLLIAP
jgi:glycerate-2-kinase